MVVIISANAHLDVSCFDKNRFYASKFRSKPFFSSWVSGSQSFTYRISLNTMKKMQVSTSSMGESVNRSAVCGIIEKDIEFKPNFDEYLKALESVKETGGERKQVRTSSRRRKIRDVVPKNKSAEEYEENDDLRGYDNGGGGTSREEDAGGQFVGIVDKRIGESKHKGRGRERSQDVNVQTKTGEEIINGGYLKNSKWINNNHSRKSVKVQQEGLRGRFGEESNREGRGRGMVRREMGEGIINGGYSKESKWSSNDSSRKSVKVQEGSRGRFEEESNGEGGGGRGISVQREMREETMNGGYSKESKWSSNDSSRKSVKVQQEGSRGRFGEESNGEGGGRGISVRREMREETMNGGHSKESKWSSNDSSRKSVKVQEESRGRFGEESNGEGGGGRGISVRREMREETINGGHSKESKWSSNDSSRKSVKVQEGSRGRFEEQSTRKSNGEGGGGRGIRVRREMGEGTMNGGYSKTEEAHERRRGHFGRVEKNRIGEWNDTKGGRKMVGEIVFTGYSHDSSLDSSNNRKTRRSEEGSFGNVDRWIGESKNKLSNDDRVRGNLRNTQREQERFRVEDDAYIEEYGNKHAKEYSPVLKNENLSRSNKTFRVKNDDSSLNVESTPFRNFEESDEIVNKLPVSQREMEERIQQLAKGLNGADIDMPEWMFTKMMRSAKIRFSDYSILRVIQALGKFGNWKRVLQVIEWLQSRERYKSNRLRNVYTTALNALGKAKRPVEALNVFHAMLQQLSSYPDVVSYHSIAVTLGQAGHIKELFSVIDTMRSPPEKKFKTGTLGKWDPRIEPDIVVYNAVLNACVRRKHWEGAFWVLQQLKEHSHRPSATTHGLVMEVMFACGKYNLVHEFFMKIQKSSIPNTLAYRVLVNTLSKEGKADEAVSAVAEMEQRGIVGSAALYYDLARCLCSAGRCEEALKTIEKICKVATQPLVVTYTGLIQACVDSGNVQNGAYIFNKMTDFCSPNLVTCNIMLKAYVDNGLFDDANDLFRNMSKDGYTLSDKSEYKLRVLPDIYTFNTMLDACVAEERWDHFEFIYTRMLHHGYHFNAKRHLRMILDACRAGKEELLETTWEHLSRADRVAPPALIKERFCTKLAKGDHSSALLSINNIPQTELHAFSKSAWLNLLKENATRIQKDTLIRLIEDVRISEGENEDSNVVLQNLLTSSREFLRYV